MICLTEENGEENQYPDISGGFYWRCLSGLIGKFVQVLGASLKGSSVFY